MPEFQRGSETGGAMTGQRRTAASGEFLSCFGPLSRALRVGAPWRVGIDKQSDGDQELGAEVQMGGIE